MSDLDKLRARVESGDFSATFDFARELARSLVPARIDECAQCGAAVSPEERDWLCARCRYEPAD